MAGVGLARAIWIPSTVGLIGSIGLFAMQPYKLEPPAKLKPFVSSEKSISMARPSNWKAHELGMHGVQDTVRFEPSEQVVFELKSDLQGSLMADIAKAGDAQRENAESALADMAKQSPELARQLGQIGGGEEKKKTPLEKVHEMNRGELAHDLKGYREKDARKTTLGGLEAVESEFTFSGEGLWGARPMSGTRVTALTPDRSISLVYYAPKDQMSSLRSVFTEMRESIRFGADAGGR